MNPSSIAIQQLNLEVSHKPFQTYVSKDPLGTQRKTAVGSVDPSNKKDPDP
jgi:hypothetical protein